MMNLNERKALLQATLELSLRLQRTEANFEALLDVLEETVFGNPGPETWEALQHLAGADDHFRKLAEDVLGKFGTNMTFADMTDAVDKHFTQESSIEAA